MRRDQLGNSPVHPIICRPPVAQCSTSSRLPQHYINKIDMTKYCETDSPTSQCGPQNHMSDRRIVSGFIVPADNAPLEFALGNSTRAPGCLHYILYHWICIICYYKITWWHMSSILQYIIYVEPYLAHYGAHVGCHNTEDYERASCCKRGRRSKGRRSARARLQRGYLRNGSRDAAWPRKLRNRLANREWRDRVYETGTEMYRSMTSCDSCPPVTMPVMKQRRQHRKRPVR